MASGGALSGRFFIGVKERNPSLDFLRALAIILVLIRHFLDRNPAYDPHIPAFVTSIGQFGWSGVDLFYVLSGFLIFSIIFRQEAQGTFSWINFYLKRALRIWPAYFASLAVCMVVGQFTIRPEELTYFIFFLQNYVGPLSQLNGGVYWSIAVEEHFYLLAPLLLVASAAVRRYRLYILLLLVVIPPILGLIVYETVVQGDMAKFYYDIYFPTHMRFDALAMGVLCAYLLAHHRHLFQLALVRRLLPLVCLSLLAVAIITTVPLNRYSQHPGLAAAVIGFSATPAFWASVLLIGETFRIFDRFGRGPMQVNRLLVVQHVPVSHHRPELLWRHLPRRPRRRPQHRRPCRCVRALDRVGRRRVLRVGGALFSVEEARPQGRTAAAGIRLGGANQGRRRRLTGR
jgi:peptidoglycan/LPS O-acetylase OafA/YrhL